MNGTAIINRLQNSFKITCTDHRIIEILGLHPSNRLPVSYYFKKIDWSTVYITSPCTKKCTRQQATISEYNKLQLNKTCSFCRQLQQAQGQRGIILGEILYFSKLILIGPYGLWVKSFILLFFETSEPFEIKFGYCVPQICFYNELI